MNKCMLSLLTASLLLLALGCEDEPGEQADGNDDVSVLDELNQRFESVKDKSEELLEKANSPETREKIRKVMDDAREDLDKARGQLAQLKEETQEQGSEAYRQSLQAAREAVEEAEQAYRQSAQQAEEIIENQQDDPQ